MFEAVRLTKHADPDKYWYSGYRIGFDARSQFSWEDFQIAGAKALLVLELVKTYLCILIIKGAYLSS